MKTKLKPNLTPFPLWSDSFPSVDFLILSGYNLCSLLRILRPTLKRRMESATMSEEIPATNGVSAVGEDSTMEVMTNGEAKTEEVEENNKAQEEKSIMEMIAAGDFDAAEENAASGEASANEKSDQPAEEAVNKEEEKTSEVPKEASEVVEKSKEEGSDEEKKEEQEAEGKDEVGSGEHCKIVTCFEILTTPYR